jgi:hypothetical protein
MNARYEKFGRGARTKMRGQGLEEKDDEVEDEGTGFGGKR